MKFARPDPAVPDGFALTDLDRRGPPLLPTPRNVEVRSRQRRIRSALGARDSSFGSGVIAAVAGAFAGACWGLGGDKGVPQDWIDQVEDTVELGELADRLAEVSL